MQDLPFSYAKTWVDLIINFFRYFSKTVDFLFLICYTSFIDVFSDSIHKSIHQTLSFATFFQISLKTSSKVLSLTLILRLVLSEF